MSYDLNFWKEEKPMNVEPLQIYKDLCEGLTVEGLCIIPAPDFLNRIAEAFPNSEIEEDGSVFWENDENSFHATSGTQHVRVDCYGTIGEWMNVFIDIANEFDMPLYDPQVNERFSG
ncbi:hypothetical protein [Motilimonas eburnea]|uniref:hypothetical protein n=1 Tax=Motilimonas eburnea TaxID=1737488 RepID=UPI001E578FCB|nr:hypothetical protein [Motilimonas eburnea]MCE2570656.1 hypothetical protein [Motilimonas eburnea]